MRDSNEAGQPPHTPHRPDEREINAPFSLTRSDGRLTKISDELVWTDDVAWVRSDTLSPGLEARRHGDGARTSCRWSGAGRRRSARRGA